MHCMPFSPPIINEMTTYICFHTNYGIIIIISKLLFSALCKGQIDCDEGKATGHSGPASRVKRDDYGPEMSKIKFKIHAKYAYDVHARMKNQMKAAYKLYNPYSK